MGEHAGSGDGPPYEVRIVHSVRIDTAEPGVTLAADVFLPLGPGRAPAVVTVSPYRRDALGGAGCWETLRRFAEHGYAGVLVDLRGLGSSDGPARPPFDPAEADDGVAAVEWAARQPWCTGTVGMWGFSNGAALALRTATRRPRHLKAVVSVMGLLDPERDFVHPGGARGWLGPLGVWGLGTLVNQLLPPLSDHHDAAEQRRWRDRVEHADPYLADACRHQPGHPVWRSRAIDARRITTPTLCVAGWRDAFCDASVRVYEEVRGPRRLLVGPWLHTLPDDGSEEPVDVHALMLRWWDRWLRDVPDGVDDEPAVTLHVQGFGPEWRSLEEWPPPSEPTALAATVDGRLRGVHDQTAGSGPLAAGAGHDPTVGSLSGLWGIPTGSFGLPLDQHDDDLRGVAFTGEPLSEALTLIGRPSVALAFTAARRPGRLVVKLADVDPSGRSTLVSGGILAPDEGTTDSALLLDPTGYRFAPGHRLRVVVSDSAFPRVWPAVAAPADDDRLRLEGLVLRLPTVPSGPGKPASVDRPVRPPGHEPAVRETPRWEIHRDLLRGAVTVVVAADLSAVLPSSRLSFRQATDLRATVAPGSPAAARLRGTSTTDVRLATGERVAVRVELLVTPEAAVAEGEVGVDGTTISRRRWHVLTPADAGSDESREHQDGRAGGERGVIAGDEGRVPRDG